MIELYWLTVGGAIGKVILCSSLVCARAFVQAVQILREWIGNGFSAVTFFRVLRCDNIYQQGADLCKALLQVSSASDEISASDINLLPSCAYAFGEPRFSTRKVNEKLAVSRYISLSLNAV